MTKRKESPFERVEAEVMQGAQDYLKGSVWKRIKKYGEFSLLAFIGFILISMGLAEVLATFFPTLQGGFSYLVLGVLYLVIGFLIKM